MVSEIVSLKTNRPMQDQEFISAIDQMDADFLSKTKGYVGTELIRGREDQAWTVIIHWKNLAQAQKALKEFAQSPYTQKYRDCVDHKSVCFHMTDQVYTWN